MIVRKLVIIGVLSLAMIPGACAGGSSRDGGTGDRTGEGTSAKAAPNRAEVPDLVGKGLQSAQNQAKSAGFETESHDATPRNRAQLLDKDWKVCFQEPEAGSEEAKSTKIQVGVVKLAEECPESDQSKDKPTLGPDKKLPDFAGRNLAEIRDALGNDASIEPVDATDEGRNVFLEKNWQVCSQDPGPGTEWSGQPITVKVVKYGEKCP